MVCVRRWWGFWVLGVLVSLRGCVLGFWVWLMGIRRVWWVWGSGWWGLWVMCRGMRCSLIRVRRGLMV